MPLLRHGTRAIGSVVLIALALTSHVMLAEASRAMPVLAIGVAPFRGAQADFSAGAGARTVCVRLDRPEVLGTACWNVYRLGRGGDPNFDYFVWGFQGSATARDGHRIQRLKLRMVSPEGENVRWAPGSTADFSEPQNVEVKEGFIDPKSTVFRALPGRVHPYPGKHIYHVSWLDPHGKGVECCPEAQVAAITEWKAAEGALMMPAKLTLEVSYR